METLNNTFLHHTKMIKRRSIIRVLALIYFICAFVMGINHIYETLHISTLSIVLISNALLSLFNITLLANDKISDRYASYLISFPLFIMMLYLIYSGGVANTGFLWIFIVPIVFLYLHGLKSGLILLSVFLGSILLILFMPNDALLIATYSSELKIRIILVFVLAILLASVYEYFNEVLFNEIRYMAYKLESIANEDQLTQIYNRRGILHFIQISREKQISPYGIILCDIDYFKKFNDTYGHEIGDKVLIHIAHTIQQSIDRQGVVARWGGEEFLIFLPLKTQKETYNIANKIRQNIIKNPLILDDMTLKVTVSMGYTATSDLSIDTDDIIQKADKYMYEAKEAGRDCIHPLP